MKLGSDEYVLPTRKIIALGLSFLLSCIVGGAMLAGIAMPAVATLSAGTSAAASLVSDLPKSIEIVSPSQQSVLLAADGSTITTFYADNRIVVPSQDIAPIMKKAIIAIEDQRFFSHKGLDLEGTIRALVGNLSGASLSGGSTITQQYIKNVLIELGLQSNDPQIVEDARRDSIGRKIREARYALALEKQSTKDEILTGYLNIVPFGPTVYGVEAASRQYFSKSAKELSLVEAATLAAIVQSPSVLDPTTHPENNLKRRNLVLNRMYKQKYITKDEYEKATKVTVKSLLKVSNFSRGCASAGNAAYFCEYVLRYLADAKEIGATHQERLNKLYRGGLVIHSTLDPKQQKAAYSALTAYIPVNDPSSVNTAMTALNPTNGHVVAMAQNTNFGSPTKDDPGATQINLNVDKAHGGTEGFQTGSTFKPFILTNWLAHGHSLYETLDVTPHNFPGNSWKGNCMNGNLADYFPQNFIPFYGKRTALYSLERSINVPFIEMAQDIGLCSVFDIAADFGVKRGDGKPLSKFPGVLLGGNTSYGLSAAQSFSVFANNGKRCDTTPVTLVTDTLGNPILQHKTHCEPVISSDLNAQMVFALQKVGQYYSDVVGLNRPFGMKTGTTDQSVASWTIGFTPQLVSAVWVGNKDKNLPLTNITINGRWYKEVFGASIAAPIFDKFMREGIRDVPVVNFPSAKNILYPPGSEPAYRSTTTRPAPQQTPTTKPKPTTKPRNHGRGNGNNTRNESESPQNTSPNIPTPPR